MGERVSARAHSASRHVHRTRVLNLSGDALGAFWASLVGGLWRSEKPPDVQSRDPGGRRTRVTGELWGHVWVTLAGSVCFGCIILTCGACWNITREIVFPHIML